jgi:hypothetical protein
MRELKVSAHTWDYTNKFTVERVRGDVSLERDYHKAGDGIYWGMQSGICIQATYTEEERAHRDRMNTMKPLKNGETVIIDGERYKVRILGNYSDCMMFDKVD